jgi:multisite-specific tRNA:(cytosine-C5)-methyltransferase
VKLLDYKPEIIQNIVDFYGINESFPKNLLYFQKATSKKIVLLDHGLDKIMGYKRKYKMNIVYIGVKLFSKNREEKSEGRYRINQDGLDLLLPYMNDKRKVHVSKDLFLHLLDKHSMTFDELANE